MSIARGDVYVVNLVGHTSAPIAADPSPPPPPPPRSPATPSVAVARSAANQSATTARAAVDQPAASARTAANPAPTLTRSAPDPSAAQSRSAADPSLTLARSAADPSAALARSAVDPSAALARVAALPGARYGGVLRGNGWWVATASPETLISVSGGRAVTRPIKGTRPATPAGRAELLASAKERAEHVMIVDLERNDLGRIAAVGSVRVDELFALRRWSGLWQAESTVSARLAPGVGLAELLAAVWPGGSVTGAPKLAAIAVATALEPVGRGPSMGACGWIGHDRHDRHGRIEVDLGLTIRTVAIADGRAHLWAGGGIVWDSDPEAEVAEAAAKMAPIKRALESG